MFNGSRPRIQNCYQSEWTQFIAIPRHEHASKSWKEEAGTNFLIWIHFDRNTYSVVVLIRVEHFHNWQDCSFLIEIHWKNQCRISIMQRRKRLCIFVQNICRMQSTKLKSKSLNATFISRNAFNTTRTIDDLPSDHWITNGH